MSESKGHFAEPGWTAPERGTTGSGSNGSVWSGRLLALGVLLTIGLASVAGGVLLDRYILLPRIFGRQGPPPRWGGGPPGGRGDRPDRGRQAFHDRLAGLLALTPAQRAQMDTLMDRQERELRAAHEIVQPRIDSIVRDTRTKLDSLLTPAQRQKLDSLRQRGEFGPPGSRGRRGRGGPAGPADRPTPPLR